MHLHYLQHEPFEELAYIAEWADDNGHTVSCTRLFANEILPADISMDALIIMGGGMGVYEEEKYPWLTEEKKFIHNVISAGKKVMGICLGAQLIAASLGEKVYPNQQKEIGWFPIHPARENIEPEWLYNIMQNHPVVFHWHGDTFDLPQNAVLIASSKACKNQLFVIGRNIIGIQFHFEATISSVQSMVASGESELKKYTYIQTASEILSLSGQYVEQGNKAMEILLDNWLQ